MSTNKKISEFDIITTMADGAEIPVIQGSPKQNARISQKNFTKDIGLDAVKNKVDNLEINVADDKLKITSVVKTYQTEALALADKNPIDTTTSLPLTVGQFVSIVNDGEKNGIYRIASISGDGTMSLELQGKLGDLSDYAKKGGSTKTLKEVEDDTSVKMTNLLQNSSFENGVVSPIYINDGGGGASTLSINTINPISGNYDARLEVTTPATSNDRPILNLNGNQGGWVLNHIFYFGMSVKVNNGTPIIYGALNGAIIVPLNLTLKDGFNSWTVECTGLNNFAAIYLNGSTLWDFNFDNLIAYDLTAIFGEGNEPTKEEMDLLISTLGTVYSEGGITTPAQKIMQCQLKLANTAAQNVDDINKKLKDPDIILRPLSDLYQLKGFVVSDGGIVKNVPTDITSGFIEVNEGDIVYAENVYSVCSFFDENKSNRILLDFPATTPEGYHYAALQYARGSITGENVKAQIIPKDAKITNTTVDFISQEEIDDETMVESAKVSFTEREKQNTLLNRISETGVGEIKFGKYINFPATFDNAMLGRLSSLVPIGGYIKAGESYGVGKYIKCLVKNVERVVIYNINRVQFADINNIAVSLIDYDPSNTHREVEIPMGAYYMYASTSSVLDSVYASINIPNSGDSLNDIYYSNSNITENLLREDDIKTEIVSAQKYRYNHIVTGIYVPVSGQITSSTTKGRFLTHPINTGGAKTAIVQSEWVEKVLFLEEPRWKTDVDIQNKSISSNEIFNIPETTKYIVLCINTGVTEELIMDAVDSLVVNFDSNSIIKDEYREEIVSIGDKFIGFTENEQAINEIPRRIDDRYVNDFSFKQKVSKALKYDKMMESLRNIKTNESGYKTFHIENTTGVELNDVTLILNVHKGSEKGTPINSDLYMDDLCKSDFSDIRFLGSNDDLLDSFKLSSGNYEIVADSNLRTYTIADSKGVLFSSNKEQEGISKSEDNAVTWTKIIDEGLVIGFNHKDDLFFSKNGYVYKADKIDNYISPKIVLEVEAVWGRSSFKLDDVNNIYLGKYTTEFGVEIFKSADGGDTWEVCFEEPLKQHVHSIIMDKSTTPYTIYANLDGNIGATDGSHPATAMSTDRGETWEYLPIPFHTDYGVIYADKNVRIGGGEGAIKSTPSIYRTTDNINWEIVEDFAANTQNAYKLNKGIYIGGGSHTTNSYARIYRSDDDGKNFTIAYDNGFIEHTDMGASQRNGFNTEFIPMGDSESQLFLTPNTHYDFQKLPRLRLYDGGDHYQAIYYVTVPTFPLEGIDLKVGYGYMVEDIEGDIFGIGDDSNIINYPLNEFSEYIYDSRGGEYRFNGKWMGEVTKRYGWLIPEKSPVVSSAAQFNNDSYITIPKKYTNFNKGFSINLWMQLKEIDIKVDDKKFIIGRDDGENSLYLFRGRGSRLGIKYGGNTKYIYSVFKDDMLRKFQMFTFSITNDEMPLLKVYINGRLSDEVVLEGFNNDMSVDTEWNIGGLHSLDTNESESAYFTDVSISDLKTDNEVRWTFEGCKSIRP